MRLYESVQPLSGGWLLREPDVEPLVEQVRKVLDVVEREQTALPIWMQRAFAPWLISTRRWLDDPSSASSDEQLREVLERLRAYRALITHLTAANDVT